MCTHTIGCRVASVEVNTLDAANSNMELQKALGRICDSGPSPPLHCVLLAIRLGQYRGGLSSVAVGRLCKRLLVAMPSLDASGRAALTLELVRGKCAPPNSLVASSVVNPSAHIAREG